MARTTSSPSLAPRLPMTSEAPARAIAKAVALPMPVPPPVTMPTLLAKDVMSAPPRGRRRVVIPGAGVRVDGQRCVGAVQMFHRSEDQVGVADVLDVVEQILAGAEMEVSSLTGQVGDLACGAVECVLAAAAGGDGCPEVVEHVAVGVPTLSGRESDLPHPDSGVLAEQPRP